jgi:uncharacterized protein (DUF2336 family)
MVMGLKGSFARPPGSADGRTGGAEGSVDGEAGLDPEVMSYLFDEPGGAVPEVEPEPAADEGDNDLEFIDFSSPDEVRASLAGKLARLLPALGRDRRNRVFDLTCLALERLARDETLVVRVALATAIKDVACAPPAVCWQLAQDVEAVVAEPILRCCANLNDKDLLAFLRNKPPPWALAAIASRPALSSPVSDALVDAGDAAATTMLIENHGAEISEPTLADIVEQARHNTEWQGRLVRRPLLPRRLAVRLATFVDRAALEYLRGRKDLDAATAREVVAVARRRIEWLRETDPGESVDRRAARLFRKGELTESALEDALSWKQFDFARMALAMRAGVPPLLVDKILQSHSGRAVTALAWRADLTMRTAFLLQKEMSVIAPNQFVYPRDGVSYPLGADEMTWQLEFFGVPPRPD